MKKILLSAAFLSSLPAAAFETPLKVDGDQLKASIQYSMYENTSSNDDDSDSEKINLKAKVNYQTKTGDWGQNYSAEALNSQSNDSAGIERYNIAAKGMRFLQRSDYIYARLSAEKDLQNGYDYEAELDGGYGRTFYDTDTSSFTAEIGAGARYLKAQDPLLDNDLEPVATAAALFETQLLSNLDFSQKLDTTLGTELQSYSSLSSFSAAISESLAATLSYEISIDDSDIDRQREQISLIGVTYQMP